MPSFVLLAMVSAGQNPLTIERREWEVVRRQMLAPPRECIPFRGHGKRVRSWLPWLRRHPAGRSLLIRLSLNAELGFVGCPESAEMGRVRAGSTRRATRRFGSGGGP